MDEPRTADAYCGEIVDARPNALFVVRLADGREVVAVLARRRKFGCLFGWLVGWRAEVVIPHPPRMPRIVELDRPK